MLTETVNVRTPSPMVDTRQTGCKVMDRPNTSLDMPAHQAVPKMPAPGANVTDYAVIAGAATDVVMPKTE